MTTTDATEDESYPEGARMPARFTVERVDGPSDVAVLELAGELDMASAPEFRDRVAEALGEGVRLLVIDMCAATFMDSSILKELLRANDDSKAGNAQLVIASVPPAVARLLEITRTTPMFTIADDRDAALAV